MPMTSAADTPSQESGLPGTFYMALRVLGIVVLALMLLSMLYSGWIALENWGYIQV